MFPQPPQCPINFSAMVQCCHSERSQFVHRYLLSSQRNSRSTNFVTCTIFRKQKGVLTCEYHSTPSEMGTCRFQLCVVILSYIQTKKLFSSILCWDLNRIISIMIIRITIITCDQPNYSDFAGTREFKITSTSPRPSCSETYKPREDEQSPRASLRFPFPSPQKMSRTRRSRVPIPSRSVRVSLIS